MGSDVLFEGHRTLTVSGVIENYPYQSHLTIEMLAHFDHYYSEERSEVQQYLRTDWLYNPVMTYVLLKPGKNPLLVETELNALKDRHADERVIKGVTLTLQPLKNIHLHSDFSFAEETNNMRDVYILSSIGLLILLLACINFINLSNVHSLKRAKEIGVRKVLGAQKSSLMIQFLSESSALVLVSFMVAFTLLAIILPVHKRNNYQALYYRRPFLDEFDDWPVYSFCVDCFSRRAVSVLLRYALSTCRCIERHSSRSPIL